MTQRERRSNRDSGTATMLRSDLTPQQRRTMATMEQLGWTLRFVRRALFQAPVPVMFAADGNRWVVLEPEGTIEQNPRLVIRAS